MTHLMSTNVDTEEGRYCPACAFDWRAGQIPLDYVEQGLYGHTGACQKLREWDTNWDPNVPCTCPPRFYSRLIGTETPGYDGVSLWRCPDCGTLWDRWTGEEVQQR